MAVKQIIVSDLSGEEIVEGRGAHVRILLDSQPRAEFMLDTTEDEVARFIEVAAQKKKRGHKPSTNGA